MVVFFFFFKQKTAYEMRISDWSSDVCSSDLTVNLSAVVQQVLEDQAVASVARDVQLAYEPPPGVVLVRGDALLLGLLVRNLVDNAVRYTPAGGQEIGRASCRERVWQYV